MVSSLFQNYTKVPIELVRGLGTTVFDQEGKSYLDFSPEGKRAMLAKAHLKARQESGTYFG